MDTRSQRKTRRNAVSILKMAVLIQLVPVEEVMELMLILLSRPLAHSPHHHPASRHSLPPRSQGLLHLPLVDLLPILDSQCMALRISLTILTLLLRVVRRILMVLLLQVVSQERILTALLLVVSPLLALNLKAALLASNPIIHMPILTSRALAVPQVQAPSLKAEHQVDSLSLVSLVDSLLASQ